MSLDEARSDGLVAGLVALFLVHYALYSGWFIEDAAITFAYARHLAEGLGPVPQRAGEISEGFSNPTWTFILALGMKVGASPWWLAKVLGAALGALTVWESRRLLREARGAVASPADAIAPLLLAVSPQHVLWAASGLENPLHMALLTGGMVRLLAEARTGSAPWSALWWGLLAVTRPEGPIWAVAAAPAAVVWALQRQPWRSAARQIGLFVVIAAAPWLVYEGWRLQTFGWPLPNTYYAKIGESDFLPWDWEHRGWYYLRDWAFRSGWGVGSFVVLLGLFGRQLPGNAVWASTTLVLGLLFVLGADWTPGLPEPPKLDGFWAKKAWNGELSVAEFGRMGWVFQAQSRVVLAWSIIAVAPTWALLKGNAPASLFGSVAGMGIFFAMYSGGDWMEGGRWVSLFFPAWVALFGLGLVEAKEALEEIRPGKLGIGALALGLVSIVAVCVQNTAYHLSNPDVSPYDIHRRVLQTNGIAQRLELDHPTFVEVDLGAQLWWSEGHVIDVAGLVDVPIAHHNRYPGPFVLDYVWAENRPATAHLHGYWAKHSKIGKTGPFPRYVALPGVASSVWASHIGTFLDRDVLTGIRVPVDERAFGGGIVLVGAEFPEEIGVQGRTASLHAAFRAPSGRPPPFRALAVLQDEGGHLFVQELAPGLDWLTPPEWDAGEDVGGIWPLPVPPEAPPGAYRLSVVLLNEDGAVMPALDPSPTPALARGEVLTGARLRVVDPEEGLRLVNEARSRLDVAAQAGRCEEAEAGWRGLRRIASEDTPEVAAMVEDVKVALGRCRGRRAPSQAPAGAARDHREARWWSPLDPELRGLARDFALERMAASDAAAANKEVQAAYDAAAQALLADPTLGWARRKAEALRDERLGIGDFQKARKEKR